MRFSVGKDESGTGIWSLFPCRPVHHQFERNDWIWLSVLWAGIVTHWTQWSWSPVPVILCLLWCEVTSQQKAELSAEHTSFHQFAPGAAASFQLNAIHTKQEDKEPEPGGVPEPEQHREGMDTDTGPDGAGIIVTVSAAGYQLWLCTMYWTLRLLQRTGELCSPRGLLRAQSPADRAGLHLPWLCQAVCQAAASTTCWAPQFPLRGLSRSKYPTGNWFNKSNLGLPSDCTLNFSLPTSKSGYCPIKPTTELQGVKYNCSTNIYPIEKWIGRTHFPQFFRAVLSYAIYIWGFFPKF